MLTSVPVFVGLPRSVACLRNGDAFAVLQLAWTLWISRKGVCVSSLEGIDRNVLMPTGLTWHFVDFDLAIDIADFSFCSDTRCDSLPRCYLNMYGA
jgi:hypothetical protein